MPNFDSFENIEETLRGTDAFICCLGTRVKVGADLFDRVDRVYPLEFARLAFELNAKHYGLLTSQGADASSMLLYTRTKGLAERDITAVNQRGLMIYRPGLLLNRRNDNRFME